MISSVKSQPNHYETLGLTPAASDDDIAEAYAARINKYLVPPDLADPGLRDEARQFMLAYKTLSDPNKRRAYDASLTPEPEPQDRSEPADPEVRPFIAASAEGPAEDWARDPSTLSEPPLPRADEAGEGPSKHEASEHSSAVAAQGFTLGYLARKHKLSRQSMLAYRTLSAPGRRRADDTSLASTEKSEPPKNRMDRAAETQVQRTDKEPNSAVAAQGYTLGYFARKHNLGREQARELVARVGNDREKLNAAAEELKAAPEPSPAPEPSVAAEPSPPLKPSGAAPAERDHAVRDQTRWAPVGDASSAARARRHPAAATAAGALVGVALVAITALLLGGDLELPGSTSRQNTPPTLEASADRSSATSNATPQQAAPEQETQLAGQLDPARETPAPAGYSTAPVSEERKSAQATPRRVAVEKQPSRPAASRARQFAYGSQARARARAYATTAVPRRQYAVRPTAAVQAKRYCIAYANIVGSRLVPPMKCQTKQDWANEGVDVDKLLRVAARLKPAAVQATRYCIAYENIVGTRVSPPTKCKTRQDWANEGVDVDKLLRAAPRLRASLDR